MQGLFWILSLNFSQLPRPVYGKVIWLSFSQALPLSDAWKFLSDQVVSIHNYLAEGVKTLAMKQLKISSPRNGELPYKREQTDSSALWMGKQGDLQEQVMQQNRWTLKLVAWGQFRLFIAEI